MAASGAMPLMNATAGGALGAGLGGFGASKPAFGGFGAATGGGFGAATGGGLGGFGASSGAFITFRVGIGTAWLLPSGSECAQEPEDKSQTHRFDLWLCLLLNGTVRFWLRPAKTASVLCARSCDGRLRRVRRRLLGRRVLGRLWWLRRRLVRRRLDRYASNNWALFGFLETVSSLDCLNLPAAFYESVLVASLANLYTSVSVC